MGNRERTEATMSANATLTDEQKASMTALVPTCDFKGVKFRDISPLLNDYTHFKLACDTMAAAFRDANVAAVAGLEARGFIFGPVVAQALGCGFIPLRKPDKMPGDLICQTYTKENGEDEICIQKGLPKPGDRVLLVDDLLATGGTLIAAAKLIQKAGAEPIGAALVIELSFCQ